MLVKLLKLIKSRKETVALLAVFLALLIAALLVGFKDNIPGIVLSYLAAIVLVFLLTLNWHEVRKFLILLGASIAGFLVFLWLNNAFSALGGTTGDSTILSSLLEFVRVVFFYIIVFICPVCWVVGAGGSVMMFIRRKKTRL
jgi:hypothetical protein